MHNIMLVKQNGTSSTYIVFVKPFTFRTAFHLHCDCLSHLHTRSATTKALSAQALASSLSYQEQELTQGPH